MTVDRQNAIWDAIIGLDKWLDSMRVDWPTPGYGGPVVHWWNHSLAYTGSGLDWRYEGIIAGYLKLWRKTTIERGWPRQSVQVMISLPGNCRMGTFATLVSSSIPASVAPRMKPRLISGC